MTDQLQHESDGHGFDPQLKCALFLDMFEVQIVRQRSSSGALQALRRRFIMAFSEQSLRISLPSGSANSDERRSAVISISRGRIKAVRVRGRLLRVAVDNGGALTVRLQDQEEALRAAEVMMETWNIDPLVEDLEVAAADNEEDVDCCVQGLVKYYMDDRSFRQLIHEIHGHIDAVLADEDVS